MKTEQVVQNIYFDTYPSVKFNFIFLYNHVKYQDMVPVNLYHLINISESIYTISRYSDIYQLSYVVND